MVIADQIREKISTTPEGVIITMSDFGIEPQYQPALAKALNRLVLSGVLKKVSKGRYYKEKKTIFGSLRPSESEIAKDFLVKNGKTVGYITGTTAFASMGLTTQISSAITIGTNKYRRPMMRGEYKISFLLQPNVITEDNIRLLRILDAIRLVREIPATTINESIKGISRIIENLGAEDVTSLCNLSMGYTPYVRALLGAMLENVGMNTQNLIASLNGTTSYKLNVDEEILPTKYNWNII